MAQGSSLSTATISGGPYAGAPTYTIFTEGGIYYAKDAYGAISWSSTSFSTVAQNTIDAAYAAGGGSIKLSGAGPYPCPTQLYIKSNVTLNGDLMQETELYATAANQVVLYFGPLSRGTSTSNLIIVGSSSLSNVTGIYVDTGSWDNFFNKIRILNTTAPAFAAIGTTATQVNVYLQDVYDSDAGMVSPGQSLQLVNVIDSQFVNVNSVQTSMTTIDNCTSLWFSRCIWDTAEGGNGLGVYLGGIGVAHSISFDNCQIYNAQRHGMQIGNPTSDNMTDISINNMLFSANGRASAGTYDDLAFGGGGTGYYLRITVQNSHFISSGWCANGIHLSWPNKYLGCIISGDTCDDGFSNMPIYNEMGTSGAAIHSCWNGTTTWIT